MGGAERLSLSADLFSAVLSSVCVYFKQGFLRRQALRGAGVGVSDSFYSFLQNAIAL